MDETDKKILSLVSRSLTLDQQPYNYIAEAVGISEEETVKRIEILRMSGIIRRIGAVINPRSIGWHSTLCAACVSEERLSDYASVVNSYDEVTHNYIRSGSPNCWFTLIAPGRDRCLEIISEIQEKLGIEILDLPANKVFKIRVGFDIR
ncbi:MAG TPA: Lrp/AsnC family transcriptional regulator [Deltaproteobacteria bacterium]|nr:Lrp/AsnC family transcriptional regulator [Deltaproteobacteria bacterium]